MQQRIMDMAVEELQGLINDLLKDVFDPSKLMNLMGINLSQLPGQQATFDPYQVLGLDRSATDEEIKHRYRQLLHKLHPDTAGVEGTNFLLQMVLAAYEIIKRERGWI